MTTFELGAGVRCTLATLIDTRLLVQANSGGGKSWLLRRLLEQTHGHVQQLVIDPEGEFATLRERYDYVLAAKQGGDTAADPRAAALLAERLLELRVSAILDIYELKHHERVKFVKVFLEALVNAPKTLWHPVLVILDEAHLFCPESGRKHGETESTGAVIDLATRGRKRGFCAVLATQRLSKLHKDAAAECNNKLIGRTGLDVDMKRAAEELGFAGREDRLQLRDLAAGEFFAFGPAISRTVTRVTIGAVRTTHPKAGARLAFTPPPPTAKVKALLPKLADLPAEAEERVRTVTQLQRDLQARDRRIRQLERAHPAPAPAKVERVEVPVLTGKQLQVLERTAARVEKTGTALVEFGGQFVTVARELLEVAKRAAGGNGRSPEIRHTVTRPRPSPVQPVPPRRETQPPAEGVSRPQQRILDALAWFEAVGLPAPEKAPLAAMADASSRSSGYQNNLSALRTAGLLDHPRAGLVALTERGRAAAILPDLPPTTAALQEAILAKVSRPQGRILRALIAAYPDPLTKDDLAARAEASPASSGYQITNNLSALRSLGMIDYPAPGQAVAQPVLFLEGR